MYLWGDGLGSWPISCKRLLLALRQSTRELSHEPPCTVKYTVVLLYLIVYSISVMANVDAAFLFSQLKTMLTCYRIESSRNLQFIFEWQLKLKHFINIKNGTIVQDLSVLHIIKLFSLDKHSCPKPYPVKLTTSQTPGFIPSYMSLAEIHLCWQPSLKLYLLMPGPSSEPSNKSQLWCCVSQLIWSEHVSVVMRL